MPSELFARYTDLQAYVGWSDADAARVKSVAQLIEGQAHLLIEDFYDEIKHHRATLNVITGGHAQITRLKASLRTWLTETLKGPGNFDYVNRRWKIGRQHVEVGLHPAYTRAALARL